jgi:hypothetical protein
MLSLRFWKTSRIKNIKLLWLLFCCLICLCSFISVDKNDCLHVLVIISKYILVNFFAGPTFVIVEYCEHGSLLCYLRNSRLEENGYVNQRYKPSRHLSTQQREPPELLTIRDLLSFAWHILINISHLVGYI